jgi:hypothetical protein
MSGGEIELVLVLLLLSSVHSCRKVFAVGKEQERCLVGNSIYMSSSEDELTVRLLPLRASYIQALSDCWEQFSPIHVPPAQASDAVVRRLACLIMTTQ